MKVLLKTSVSILFAAILLISCGDISTKVEEKLNLLNAKAEKLDSIVNIELNKVKSLDSIINVEGGKVKSLDSLINRSTSKIDSIANAKFKMLENILN